jgi:O-antigen/teichoic acid export membrane protein
MTANCRPAGQHIPSWKQLLQAKRGGKTEMSMILAAFPAVLQKLPAIRLYARSTGMLTVGIFAQSLGFVLLARWLGSDQFGHLATITAVTNVGGAWCGLGTGEAIRRRVSRDPSVYPAMLGHMLILLFLSGAILTALLTVVMASVITVAPDPAENFETILLLVTSNMVLFSWIGLTEQVHLAFRQFAAANYVNASWGITRAAAALIACVGFEINTVFAWAAWNASTSVLLSVACASAISRYGAPQWRVLREEVALGATLSMSACTSVLRQNADLLALSAVAPPHLVGAYGIARRIISAATVVGSSLDRLIYSRLAIAGAQGASETLQLAKRYVLYGMGLTGMASAGVFVASPLLPLLFGSDFADAVWITQILCWTLILTSTQFIAFDALNAAEQHHIRLLIGTAVGLAAAALIVGLSLAFGTTGTFVGVYLAEVSIAMALWQTLRFVGGRRSAYSPAAD